MRLVLSTLVFASLLLLSAPIHAEETDEPSKDKIEAPSDETASPSDAQPPAEPSEPVEEEDEG